MTNNTKFSQRDLNTTARPCSNPFLIYSADHKLPTSLALTVEIIVWRFPKPPGSMKFTILSFQLPVSLLYPLSLLNIRAISVTSHNEVTNPSTAPTNPPSRHFGASARSSLRSFLREFIFRFTAGWRKSLRMKRKVLSLRQRRREPLVHYIYITGGIASSHPLPETAYAVLPGSELEHLRVLRLHGRDRRFSFKWFGMYFEFENILSLMQSEKTRILRWQLILASLESSPRTPLETRLLRQASTSCPTRCL